MQIKEVGFSEWGRALPASGFDAFHSAEALRVLDDHGSGDLRLFGGFKGEQPIGLVPIFVFEKLGGRLVTSPPLGFGIGRLGPVVMPTSPKRRKQESMNNEFARKIIEATDADSASTIFRMVCDVRYGDPRPFEWAGFDITPAFTYRLDLESSTIEGVLESFSRDRRVEIRDRDDTNVEIRTGDLQDAKTIHEAMEERYREQDMSVPVTWDFVRDLLAMIGDQARVYVAETTEGEFLSGMIVLYSADTAYNWKGGTKSTEQVTSVSPNSLLHWQIIEDIFTDPSLDQIHVYDMYTANNERLSRYKSSFGGDLVPYYVVETAGVRKKIAEEVYRMAVSPKSPVDVNSFL